MHQVFICYYNMDCETIKTLLMAEVINISSLNATDLETSALLTRCFRV